MTEREEELRVALATVRRRIDEAAAAAGRNAGEIELLPITKFFPATDVATLSDSAAVLLANPVNKKRAPNPRRWQN